MQIKNIKNILVKPQIEDYNNIILDVNNFYIFENDNPYGHVREFNKLKKEIRLDAHRVISKVALDLYSKGKIYGSAIDINANTYDFEIFSDTTYRVMNVERNKEISEVITDEGYSIKNS